MTSRTEQHPTVNPPEPGVDARRGIKSFVLRQGRMSPAQTRALESLMPRYGIAFGESQLDFREVFGRTAPTVLEVGFGMGETTAAIAQAMPDHDFIGIEVHLPGVGALLKQVEARALGNVRVIRHDALAVLNHMIPPQSLAGVHLFFPDPWPKKRHHKRRIINVGLLDHIAPKLAVGGYFHMATDWGPYADEALGVLTAHPAFRNTAEAFAPRPPYRPVTKFEARGVKLGHGVWDLVFCKK
jgi:tRNA (guanine-N7-)-methyltransferase